MPDGMVENQKFNEPLLTPTTKADVGHDEDISRKEILSKGIVLEEDYLDQWIIQIAPLAFMRGRTLDKAFVILDEAQNATESQMKMFLTRMGMSAKFIITGDETQIDLPSKQKSGLVQAKEKLGKIEGISFVFLDEKDVIRHKLVKKIIKAYK